MKRLAVLCTTLKNSSNALDEDLASGREAPVNELSLDPFATASCKSPIKEPSSLEAVEVFETVEAHDSEATDEVDEA